MKGRVTQLFNTEYQGIQLYSFKVEGDNSYWRMGREEPTFKEGTWIEFETNGKNVIVESIKTSTEEPAPEPTPSAAPAQSSVGDRMRYQAARRDACNLVVAALHTDHLPHAVNVKKAQRLPLLEGYVEQVTKTLLEQEDKHVKA